MELKSSAAGSPWLLVAGQAVFDGAEVELRGGSTLVWADFALSDFVVELKYRTDPCAAVSPAVHVRGELDHQTYQLTGTRLTWRTPQARRSQRVRRWTRTRVEPADGSWQTLRVTCVGNRAHLNCGQQQLTFACQDHSDGVLALSAVGDCDANLRIKDVVITELSHRSLFNGRDLGGWGGADADASSCWEVRESQLVCTGAKGPWLRTAETFGDFNLRLEYKLTSGGNSGVYVRVPADGRHHGAGSGVEVQILDDHAEQYRSLKPYQFTAALYAIVPPKSGTIRPNGLWNALEINCHGRHYRVTHDGTVVVDASDREFPELAQRLVEGHLGLQNHSEPVWFRNIRIGPPR